MTPYELDKRLINWGRWLRVFAPQGKAMSAEGAWSTWDGMVDEAPRARLPAPGMDDAIDIEIAARLLPIRQHLLLWLVYVKRWRDGYICHRWRDILPGERLNMKQLDDLEASSMVSLRLALELPQVIRKERSLRMVRKILHKALDTEKSQDVVSV